MPSRIQILLAGGRRFARRANWTIFLAGISNSDSRLANISIQFKMDDRFKVANDPLRNASSIWRFGTFRFRNVLPH